MLKRLCTFSAKNDLLVRDQIYGGQKSLVGKRFLAFNFAISLKNLEFEYMFLAVKLFCV